MVSWRSSLQVKRAGNFITMKQIVDLTSRRNFKKTTLPLTEIEHVAFCKTEDELPAQPLIDELKVNIKWQEIPVEYLRLTVKELDSRIDRARLSLGDRLMILGHHYQRDEVIKHADVRGDSYLLSKTAANSKADYIVFCGVHFMAETARVLGSENQTIILPNITAGCSMADMAPIDDVLDAWDDLTKILKDQSIIPVTYMNSAAEIKALCGRNGGIVCTSSNAQNVFKWAFTKSKRILFLPDQHLGRNTGLKMGIPEENMVLWNPFKRMGGNSVEEYNKAKVILWRGHCSVHTRFTVGHIEMARHRFPDVKVIVHPECTKEVVAASDINGSTEVIRKKIEQAPSGTSWAIGTEISFVNRLAKENPSKNVFCLDPVVCPCSTMYRIHPAYLAWVLDALIAGVVVNEIKVEPEIAEYSRIALEAMLTV